MPKGVEHVECASLETRIMLVSLPMMPKGVEHPVLTAIGCSATGG